MKQRIGPQHPEYDQLLTTILHVFQNCGAYSFFLCLGVALLWVVGNLQGFTAATQLTLLGILEAVGWGAVVCNSYSLLLLAIWALRHRHLPLWRLGAALACLASGAALTFAAMLIGAFVNPQW